MTHHEIRPPGHRGWVAGALAALAIASASLALAQTAADRSVGQAQQAVRARIVNDGGGALDVQFAGDVRTEFPSNTTVRVRGTGSVERHADGRARPFSYEAVVDQRSNRVSDIRYDWRGDWYAHGRAPAAPNRLTGAYRLNPSRSDKPAKVADGVTRNLPPGQQKKLRAAVMERLQAPVTLAIERIGTTITMASSQAGAVTFQADGREQVEQSRNNRRMRTTAALSGDRLVVSTEGDRAFDYQVTFESIDNGRALRVTRRVTHEDLRDTVVAKSVYDKTSSTPRFGVDFDGRDEEDSSPFSASYLIPDGTEVAATLNENLTTEQARDGDRVTLTVRSPARYSDAVIQGVLTSVARSGQLAGRAGMSFDFDTIRTRDGRRYDFDGTIERVTLANGDTVRVDTEGGLQDDSSQTGRTVASTGIGAAIGAVIGAIAGGGKAAAIGAAVGAGAGAGSVFIQGRSDLEMGRGAEFQIRARTRH